MNTKLTGTLVLAAAALALHLRAEPAAAPGAGIIPAPKLCAPGTGSFLLDAHTKIVWRGEAAAADAQFLQAGIRERTGLALEILRLPAAESPANAVVLEPAAPGAADSPEGYTLAVTATGVVIRATAAGFFYGTQSLLQLAETPAAAPGGPVRLPAVRIADEPRFGWRGMMLDESRHFFGKQTVEELLDAMACLKLNRFHWHLTDEPGWRIEIKKYPRLTEIGARGDWTDPKSPAAFYTQADIREIVAYAAARHIMIIPEIDMPGHASAATRAYPEYSGGGTGQWAGFTFNPAAEGTYVFLENILREVAALFPGPYIHLGGDEVHYGNQAWSTDPEIVKFTAAHGLTNAAGLEQYFVRRMAGVVHRLGKTTLGWDEIAAAGVAPDATAVMWWRHDKPKVLTELLAQNYPVVLCPRLPCYFDFVQDASHKDGRRWNGFNDLARVYDFPEPVTDGLIPPGQAANVLGVQACVWTERIATRERLGFMIFPRLAAVAEAGWTPATAKDAPGFRERLRGFLRELDRRHLAYFDVFDPARTPEPRGPVKKAGGTDNG